MVSLPDLRRQRRSPTASRAREYRQAARATPASRCSTWPSASSYPPGSTYKLVTGLGALQDRKITPRTRLDDQGLHHRRGHQDEDWNKLRLGSHQHLRRLRPLQRHLLLPGGPASWASTGSATGRTSWASARKTGIDLPGETTGTVPTNDWKQRVFSQHIYPGETAQAGIGQGYDMVTPIQLINAYAALANGGTLYRPQLVRKLLRQLRARSSRPSSPRSSASCPSTPACCATMRVAARNVLVVRHTYNLVDLPIVIAGKSGTAEFGVRDSQGRLPFHSWFVGFTPKDARKTASDPNGFEAVARTDSQLAFLAFAYDSRTRGNAATEIAKYFLQLHYGVKKDYRKPRPAGPRQLLRAVADGYASPPARQARGVHAAGHRQRLVGVRPAAGGLRPRAGRHRAADGVHQQRRRAPRGRLAVHPRPDVAGHRAHGLHASRPRSTTAGCAPSRGCCTSSTSACWC